MKKTLLLAAAMLSISSSAIADEMVSPENLANLLESGNYNSVMASMDMPQLKDDFVKGISVSQHQLADIKKAYDTASANALDPRLQEGSALISKVSEYVDQMVAGYSKHPEFFTEAVGNVIRAYPASKCKATVEAGNKQSESNIFVKCGSSYQDKYTLVSKDGKWKVVSVDLEKLRVMNELTARVAEKVLKR